MTVPQHKFYFEVKPSTTTKKEEIVGETPLLIATQGEVNSLNLGRSLVLLPSTTEH